MQITKESVGEAYAEEVGGDVIVGVQHMGGIAESVILTVDDAEVLLDELREAISAAKCANRKSILDMLA